MNYSTVELDCKCHTAVILFLTFVLSGSCFFNSNLQGQVPPLQSLESIWVERLTYTPTDLWVDDRYGRHLIKEQHRWRSASDVFAEACWHEAALAVADYYLSPGPRNLRDLPLFLNMIRQAAGKTSFDPVYLPMHNSLFVDPLGRRQVGEDAHIHLRQAPTFRPEDLQLNSPVSKP